MKTTIFKSAAQTRDFTASSLMDLENTIKYQPHSNKKREYHISKNCSLLIYTHTKISKIRLVSLFKHIFIEISRIIHTQTKVFL